MGIPLSPLVSLSLSCSHVDHLLRLCSYVFEGEPLRVEISHGRSAPPPPVEKYTGSRRSEFRVLVTGLPPTGSWQDLKDHMRRAGDVCFSDVSRDGTGVIEYTRYEDMRYAVGIPFVLSLFSSPFLICPWHPHRLRS